MGSTLGQHMVFYFEYVVDTCSCGRNPNSAVLVGASGMLLTLLFALIPIFKDKERKFLSTVF